MKVLIVTPHIFEGGAEKALLHMTYRLNSLGCEASIATLSVDLSKLPSNFAKIDFVMPDKELDRPVLSGVGSVVSSTLREVYGLAALVRRVSGRFDLICTCNFPAYWSTFMAMTGKPVLWLSSEVLGPVNQTRDIYERSAVFRFALLAASAFDKRVVKSVVEPIVTVSELNRQLIKERYGRNALVVQTGVDYDFFNAKVSTAEYKTGFKEGPVLVQVGALMRRKNQILSIRALSILKRHFRSARLVLVGDGPWKSILFDEVKKLGLGEDVVFAGRVSESELRKLYRECDLNLFPAKDQTWGLVPFEALAAGKVSIVAEGCGAAEIIAKEKIGVIVNPTAENLADAALFALGNRGLVDDMVRRGQRYVRDNLSWDKYAQEMLEVFKRVVMSPS